MYIKWQYIILTSKVKGIFQIEYLHNEFLSVHSISSTLNFFWQLLWTDTMWRKTHSWKNTGSFMGCKKNQDTAMILSLNFRHNFNCQSSNLEPIYLHRVDVVLRAANHTCGPVQTGRGLEGDCEVVGLWYVLHCGGAGVGLHDGRKLKRQDQRKQLLWERTGGETVFIRVELKKRKQMRSFPWTATDSHTVLHHTAQSFQRDEVTTRR